MEDPHPEHTLIFVQFDLDPDLPNWDYEGSYGFLVRRTDELPALLQKEEWFTICVADQEAIRKRLKANVDEEYTERAVSVYEDTRQELLDVVDGSRETLPDTVPHARTIQIRVQNKDIEEDDVFDEVVEMIWADVPTKDDELGLIDHMTMFV